MKALRTSAAAIAVALVSSAASAAEYSVSTVAELANALASQADGDVITLAAGEYALTEQIKLTAGVRITGAGVGKTVLTRDTSVASLRLLRMASADAVVEQLTLSNGVLTAVSDGTLAGAGAYVDKGTLQDVEVVGCSIGDGGWVTGWGSGRVIALTSSDAKLLRARIHGCRNSFGDTRTSMVYVDGGAVMDSCLVYDNDIQTTAGGSVVSVARGTMRNCTVTDNLLASACAVYVSNSGSVKDSIVYGNVGLVKVSSNTLGDGSQIQYQGNASVVQSSVVDDPVFNDAANGDYSLHPASPLVDAGQYGATAVSDKDVSGATQRVLGEAVDVGAYETVVGTDPAVAVKATSSTSVLVGKSVAFALYSVNLGSPSWTVDFGDGESVTSTQSAISHLYSKYGEFTVKVSAAGAAEYTMPYTVTVVPAAMFVTPGGTGEYPYAEDAPAGTIEEALAAAVDGVTVYLEAGNHKFASAAQVTIAKGVSVVGRPTADAPVVVSPYKANSHMMFKLEHADAGLYNLTVEGGWSSIQNAFLGCNVNIGSAGGTVSNCVIRGGYCKSWGAAAAGVSMSAGLVTHCVISNNLASCANGNLKCSAVYVGGGRLENCLVTGNSGDAYGAAVCVDGSAKVVNCTIAGNASHGVAGVCFKNASASVVNTLIHDNTSTGKTGAEVVYESGYADCFTACAAPVLINDTCFTADDLKVNADYTLLSGSVCRDNGTTDGVSVPKLDLAGNPRVDASGKIDIGCYEYTVSGLEASISCDPASAAGLAPLALNFSAEIEGGTATGYRWFEDDVEIAGETGSTLSRTYAEPGSHKISLKVTDGAAEYEAANTVSVKVYPPKVTVDESTSLADAYAAAGDGTLIEVAAGEYSIPELLVEKGVTIRGLGENPSAVVFRANGQHRLFSMNNDKARIENVTISGGVIDAQENGGGGVYVYGRGGTVSNCVISSCSKIGDTLGGGGARLSSDAALLTHCVFTNCTATNTRLINWNSGGSAVLLEDGVVRETLAVGCRSVEGTSGDADATFAVYGGRVVNCTVVGNSNYGCAGVRAEGGEVVNAIVSGNVTVNSDGEATAASSWSGTASLFTHCLTDGDAAINDDCLVEAAASTFMDLAGGNYRIRLTSAAHNGGLDQADAPAADLAGRPRVNGKSIDVGCYECQSSGLMIIVK